MNDSLQCELLALKNRLNVIETQLQRKTSPVRVEKVEYRIENLIVEKLDNGTLDLGVHLGNEIGRRIEEGEESQATERVLPGHLHAEQTEDWMEEVKRLHRKIELLEMRIQAMEMRMEQLARSVAYLEGLHP
jgi:predicted RNase H-like nuclease (RuvC/YqgF family)